MKKLILFAFSLALMVSCAEPAKQYTTSSPEIDSIKTLHAYFKDSNYDGLKSLYAEDAEIYENSSTPITVDQMIQQGKDGRQAMEAYDFPEGVRSEMIINDAGEKWVNSWALWTGSVKGSDKEISVPLISRFLFKDGKIVKEYSYWDNLPSYNAFEEVAAKKLEQLEETLEEDM